MFHHELLTMLTDSLKKFKIFIMHTDQLYIMYIRVYCIHVKCAPCANIPGYIMINDHDDTTLYTHHRDVHVHDVAVCSMCLQVRIRIILCMCRLPE